MPVFMLAACWDVSVRRITSEKHVSLSVGLYEQVGGPRIAMSISQGMRTPMN